MRLWILACMLILGCVAPRPPDSIVESFGEGGHILLPLATLDRIVVKDVARNATENPEGSHAFLAYVASSAGALSVDYVRLPFVQQNTTASTSNYLRVEIRGDAAFCAGRSGAFAALSKLALTNGTAMRPHWVSPIRESSVSSFVFVKGKLFVFGLALTPPDMVMEWHLWELGVDDLVEQRVIRWGHRSSMQAPVSAGGSAAAGDLLYMTGADVFGVYSFVASLTELLLVNIAQACPNVTVGAAGHVAVLGTSAYTICSDSSVHQMFSNASFPGTPNLANSSARQLLPIGPAGFASVGYFDDPADAAAVTRPVVYAFDVGEAAGPVFTRVIYESSGASVRAVASAVRPDGSLVAAGHSGDGRRLFAAALAGYDCLPGYAAGVRCGWPTRCCTAALSGRLEILVDAADGALDAGGVYAAPVRFEAPPASPWDRVSLHRVPATPCKRLRTDQVLYVNNALSVHYSLDDQCRLSPPAIAAIVCSGFVVVGLALGIPLSVIRYRRMQALKKKLAFVEANM